MTISVVVKESFFYPASTPLAVGATVALPDDLANNMVSAGKATYVTARASDKTDFTANEVTALKGVVSGAGSWGTRGNARGLPSNDNANIGAAGSAVSGYRTVATQHPALRPFSGVWLRYLNYNTSAGLTIKDIRVSGSPTHLAPGNDSGLLSFTAAAAAKINGAALPFTTQAARAGSTGVIPAAATTDRIAVTSMARTDSATHGNLPLLRTLTNINDSSVVHNLSGANLAAFNAAAFNPGFKYGSYLYTSGTDWVNTLQSNLLLENGGAFEPVEVIFDYDVPVKPLAVFDDSNSQGVATTSTWMGWPMRLMILALNDDVPVSVSNYGHAGQKHIDSINTAVELMPSIAATNKATICIKSWSPNEGAANQGVFDACFVNVKKARAKANDYSLRLMVILPPPVASYTASQKAMLAAHNERVRALAGITVVDFAAITNTDDSTDGTHYPDAVHLAWATAVRAAQPD